MTTSIKITFSFLFALSLFTLQQCAPPEAPPPVIYDGPLREGTKVEMYYNEKGAMKMKMKADKVREFQSGDRDFPEGVYVEFYNEKGRVESTLKANEAYYFKADDQWRGRGDVVIKNLEKRDQLNTEELFWKPGTKRISTDKFVTIRQGRDVIYGRGLDAAQDLSDYTIIKPEGEFEVDEDEENR
jgi:LPS export ABC transporter protein LptC